jgi:hypothetical protein
MRKCGVAVRGKHCGDDRLVRLHVVDGHDADARRLDDVDGLRSAWPSFRSVPRSPRSRCDSASRARLGCEIGEGKRRMIATR